MLLHQRIALRHLGRRPREAIVAVTALALGTGATITLAALVNAAFVAPLAFPSPEQIVRLSERQAEIPDRRVSYPNFLDWQARNESSAFMAAVRETPLRLLRGEGARVLEARQVTADYFRVLGIAPFMGRDFTAAEDRFGVQRVAIVSAALWTTEFGAAPDIVGARLTLGDGDYTIVGVADRFSQLPGAPEVWTLTGQLAAPIASGSAEVTASPATCSRGCGPAAASKRRAPTCAESAKGSRRSSQSTTPDTRSTS